MISRIPSCACCVRKEPQALSVLPYFPRLKSSRSCRPTSPFRSRVSGVREAGPVPDTPVPFSPHTLSRGRVKSIERLPFPSAKPEAVPINRSQQTPTPGPCRPLNSLGMKWLSLAFSFGGPAMAGPPQRILHASFPQAIRYTRRISCGKPYSDPW